MCRTLYGALFVLLTSTAGAQQASEASRLPGLSFLEALGAPLSSDVAAVDGGEVALVGLVRVAVPRDFYFAHTSNAAAYLARPGREAFGVVGAPPTPADFAR